MILGYYLRYDSRNDYLSKAINQAPVNAITCLIKATCCTMFKCKVYYTLVKQQLPLIQATYLLS